ncbi:hypothetical protein NA8A_22748 [Nitratireductor indicus C115]|uniref:HTH marR-type domain-containing protein n=3 Tax=Hyphomicrobiales TaxID=356 RepID=K2PGA7_9HYPH|nr:hypothetical protein NA8A_22748 [Nitratireductor indicus C115]HMN14443.1 hypothetical protein [Bellilinea sp.]
MRISWRVSVTLLALLHSRGKKASFAKMHVLNDALRSKPSQDKLKAILEENEPAYAWRLRVEPAFTRALDFLVGEGFADWSISSNRTTLTLTERGIETAKEIESMNDVLVDEQAFLRSLGAKITESFVQQLLLVGKRLL